MVITIPSEFEHFVRQEIESGEFQSEQDIIVEGLRLLQEQKRRLLKLRKESQIGRNQLDDGLLAS